MLPDLLMSANAGEFEYLNMLHPETLMNPEKSPSV